MPESKLVEEVKRLNPPKSDELCARELEGFLRKQPFEVRKYLQAYLDNIPLTKAIRTGYYALTEEGDD